MFPADINVNDGDFAEGPSIGTVSCQEDGCCRGQACFQSQFNGGGLAIQIVNDSRNAAGEPSLSEKHLSVVGQLEFRALLIVLRQLFSFV